MDSVEKKKILEKLELKFKHSKHLMRYLQSASEFDQYFESSAEFKLAVDEFFDVSNEELTALSLLGYPINGRIFFDHEILTRIVQHLPEFMLSLIKEGKSLLFTIFQFQTNQPHKEVSIEFANIRQISENVFYIWKAISDIEVSELSDAEKSAQLSLLPAVLNYSHVHYDLMGCFQMNLMSQFIYLDSRGIPIGKGDNPTIQPDSEKRELLCEIVGYLALPIKLSDQIFLDDDSLINLQSILHTKILEAGFIQNIHKAFSTRGSLPPLKDATRRIEQIEAIDSLFRKVGDVWEVKHDDKFSILRDSKGLRYIHHLISQAPEPIRADVLVAINEKSEIAKGLSISREEYNSIAEDEKDIRNQVSEHEPLADYQVYQDGLSSLEEKLKSLPIDSDDYEETEQRIRKLNNLISKSFNYHGEQRPIADSGEKARQAVTQAINRAIRKINETIPVLGNHLDQHLRTGLECEYSPPPKEHPNWHL